jgi:hypothetical protein
VQKPAQDSVIDYFPPSAIGGVLTADLIHRDQKHDRDDHNQNKR